jgi:hypothetical protein
MEGGTGMPAIPMGQGLRLEPSSLPSSLPRLLLPNSVGAEKDADWRGSVVAHKGATCIFIFSRIFLLIFWHGKRRDKSHGL